MEEGRNGGTEGGWMGRREDKEAGGWEGGRGNGKEEDRITSEVYVSMTLISVYIPVVQRIPPNNAGRKNGGWPIIMLIAKPVSHIPMHKIHWKKRPKVGEQEREGGEHTIMKKKMPAVCCPKVPTISSIKRLHRHKVAAKEQDCNDGPQPAYPLGSLLGGVTHSSTTR